MCQIAYEGLDVSTRTMIESMCGESFFVTMLMRFQTFIRI